MQPYRSAKVTRSLTAVSAGSGRRQREANVLAGEGDKYAMVVANDGPGLADRAGAAVRAGEWTAAVAAGARLRPRNPAAADALLLQMPRARRKDTQGRHALGRSGQSGRRHHRSRQAGEERSHYPHLFHGPGSADAAAVHQGNVERRAKEPAEALDRSRRQAGTALVADAAERRR